MVVDDGPDFGVGGVVCDEGGFNLHLLDEIFVVLGLDEDVFIV